MKTITENNSRMHAMCGLLISLCMILFVNTMFAQNNLMMKDENVKNKVKVNLKESKNHLMTSFTAEYSNSNLQLKWTILKNPLNDNTYWLEKSGDGYNFEVIGNMEAPESSNDFELNYTFTDQTPIQGQSYYRILSIEDGLVVFINPMKKVNIGYEYTTNALTVK